MSTVDDNQVWTSISKENLNSKYEKCRNITEEIYKRINITFQIKKLENEAQSDISELSDQIDSNDLSNETDLFACDKTDSIPSSEVEPPAASVPFINNNNNEETKKKAVVYKRPKKRFRKRVKKRTTKPQSESDGSSDEALPLSRVVELDTAAVSPDHAGVPNILILTKDVKPKILSTEKKQTKKKSSPPKNKEMKPETKFDIEQGGEVEGAILNFPAQQIEGKVVDTTKTCSFCKLSFSGERGLRRHIAITHSVTSEEMIWRPEREVKPA